MTAYHLVYFLTDVRVNGEGSTCSSFQERCLRDAQDCSVIGLAQFSENHVNADMDYQHSITCTIQTGTEIIVATSITKNALSRCNATFSEILLTLCGDRAEKGAMIIGTALDESFGSAKSRVN